MGRQELRHLRPARDGDRQAAVRRRREPLARLLDRRGERSTRRLLPRRAGRARLVGVPALRGEHRVRGPDLRGLARRPGPRRPVPRLRPGADRLHPRRQPARQQLRRRHRTERTAEPAPPHRARVLAGLLDAARADPARPVRRPGGRSELPGRRVRRRPRGLRGERGRHGLQRRVLRCAGRARRRPRRDGGPRVPRDRDTRRAGDLRRGAAEPAARGDVHRDQGDDPQPVRLARPFPDAGHGTLLVPPRLRRARLRRDPEQQLLRVRAAVGWRRACRRGPVLRRAHLRGAGHPPRRSVPAPPGDPVPGRRWVRVGRG